MKKLIAVFAIITTLSFSCSMMASAQAAGAKTTVASADTLSDAALDETGVADQTTAKPNKENTGFHQELKQKFIEGNAGFMSLVALALVLGLAFCIERIIYLSLSEIDAKRFMDKLEDKIVAGDIEGAKDLSRDTRGPVASICYQGLLRIDDSIENIERSVTSYGSVQSANLEKGCSWITLFIAMAPSLGLDHAFHRHGTVIGIPWNGDWYGNGIRSDTGSRGYQSDDRCCWYESSIDNNHLRYHCCLGIAGVLQLYPL